MSSSADLADYRRRAVKYRALAAKAADVRERDGLLSVAILLEALAQNVEREDAQQQPKA